MTGKNQDSNHNLRLNKGSESYLIQIKQSETQMPLMSDNVVPPINFKINNMLPSDDITLNDNNQIGGTVAQTANVSYRTN